MLSKYIDEALERAKYEIIEDEEPYYAEIPELKGVWATGNTLETCRRNLIDAIEDWLFFDPFIDFSNKDERTPSLG